MDVDLPEGQSPSEAVPSQDGEGGQEQKDFASQSLSSGQIIELSTVDEVRAPRSRRILYEP
jgi:hypothetical protein